MWAPTFGWIVRQSGKLRLKASIASLMATGTEQLLTVDKLNVRNWPCNIVCSLCNQDLETADHLCLQCVFAQGVWVLVEQWSVGLVQVPDREATLKGWWNSSPSPSLKKQKATIHLLRCSVGWWLMAGLF
jgi:hypothetical protein